MRCNMETKAALYIRVSTVMQADRDSLPLQRSDLINYTKYVLDIQNYEIFEDAGYSAKNTDRPKYQEMINRVRNREFSHILVWKIDRISRNLIDFCEMHEEIKKYNTAFISKNEQFDTSSAMGEAMLKIILVFAELERKLTGERVLSVMIDRASKGLWNGGIAPYGYFMNKTLDFPIIEDEESQIVVYIFNLYEKLESTVTVARELHNNGYRTRNGNIWNCEAVHRILTNPFYSGTYRYNYRNSSEKAKRRKNENEWVSVEDNHEAIITKEQFNRVQRVMKSNHRGGSQSHRKSSSKHVFSGIVFCENCMQRFTPGPGPIRKDGVPSSRYHCANYNSGDQCSGTIGDVMLVPFVFNYLSNYCKLSEKITKGMKNATIEKILLHGIPFASVNSLSLESMENIRFLLLDNKWNINEDHLKVWIKEVKNDVRPPSSISNEIKKYEVAILRLEELYLFSSEAIGQTEYIIKKSQLQEKLNDLRDKEKKELANSDLDNSADYYEFMAGFVLFKKFIDKNNTYDYETLMLNVGREVLHKIFTSVISKIYIKNNAPQSIIFKNGLIHKFNWKPGKIRATSKISLFLNEYQDKIMDYVNTNGYITQKIIREMADIDKVKAQQVIRALKQRKLIFQVMEDGKNHYYKQQV